MKKILVLILTALLAFPVTAQTGSRKKNAKAEKTDKMSVDTTAGTGRIIELLNLVDRNYVETPDMNKLSEEAVKAMLKSLDPHSVYIAAKDVERANEGLEGNFEGVGVSFQIVNDTISVTSVISGGPSEKVGIMVGDKFLRIDGDAATGDSIKNDFVFKHLRGKKGTTVVVDVLRQGQVYNFHIVRDKIPIYSVDTYFMADDTIGYIRLTRFARTSINEVRKAIKDLKKQGMTALMLDLRGNSGGFLDIANALANEFLPTNSLIVYTEGRESPRQNFRANSSGSFRKGRLVVLIDEGSASASEIVSGAVQDWDRGILVGRRSFGKGLVQRMFTLHDGAQVRLTTARYYTPSGRCIQKPYSNGTDEYLNDVNNRYKHGELVNADSIHFPDSLKYKTSKGRTVYGGGGIMPDVFVPLDTMRLSDYCISMRGKGLFNTFSLQWADAHRGQREVADYETFIANYDTFGLDSLFAAEGIEKGVVRDIEKEALEPARTTKSDQYMHLLLKADVARNLFGIDYYYKVMKEMDDGYNTALKQLQMK